MASFLRLAVLGIATIFATLGTSWAHDGAYQINAAVKMLVAGGLFIWTLRWSGRGGSASLNRFRAFSKWFSALATPLPFGASAG